MLKMVSEEGAGGAQEEGTLVKVKDAKPEWVDKVTGPQLMHHS